MLLESGLEDAGAKVRPGIRPESSARLKFQVSDELVKSLHCLLSTSTSTNVTVFQSWMQKEANSAQA